jgi:hypothetical protein
MLKAWHDIVVESGENPRPLLAAAFVNASSNNLMARQVIGEGGFVDGNIQDFDDNNINSSQPAYYFKQFSSATTYFDLF